MRRVRCLPRLSRLPLDSSHARAPSLLRNKSVGDWRVRVVASASRTRLLVGPLVHGVLVGGDTLGEPEADLVLGGLDGVRAVDHVAAHLDAEVAADGAGLGSAARTDEDGAGEKQSAKGSFERVGARCRTTHNRVSSVSRKMNPIPFSDCWENGASAKKRLWRRRKKATRN